LLFLPKACKNNPLYPKIVWGSLQNFSQDLVGHLYIRTKVALLEESNQVIENQNNQSAKS